MANKRMKNFSFITGAVLITFLVSCSSSNQLASSFGERKYMKGHFSDPIATIKSNYLSGTTSATTYNKQRIEIPNSVALLHYIIHTKVSSPIVTKTSGLSKKQVLANSQVSISPSISSKENASVKVKTDESIVSYHHDNNNDTSSSDHHYLKFFLIFLLVSIIFLLLLLVFGGSGAGVVAFLIAIGSFIIALVFLFLWLISLAG